MSKSNKRPKVTVKLKTIVVAGFPGVGKSYCLIDDKLSKLNMIDSDSSSFSHIYTQDRISKSNLDFPDNYIDYIRNNIGKYDVIFVSTHAIVREALKEEQIPYILVYPDLNEEDVKLEYIVRYQKRNNDKKFIKFMSENWDKFLGECFIEEWPVHYELKKNEYLSDVLQDIYELNTNLTQIE